MLNNIIVAVIAVCSLAAVVPSGMGLPSFASEPRGLSQETPSHSLPHSVSSGHLWARRCRYLRDGTSLTQKTERWWWIHGGIFWRQQQSTLIVGSHMKLSKGEWFKRIKKRNKDIFTLYKIYFIINSSECEVVVARLKAYIAFWQSGRRWGSVNACSHGGFALMKRRQLSVLYIWKGCSEEMIARAMTAGLYIIRTWLDNNPV